jgi:hypothetical protein
MALVAVLREEVGLAAAQKPSSGASVAPQRLHMDLAGRQRLGDLPLPSLELRLQRGRLHVSTSKSSAGLIGGTGCSTPGCRLNSTQRPPCWRQRTSVEPQRLQAHVLVLVFVVVRLVPVIDAPIDPACGHGHPFL